MIRRQGIDVGKLHQSISANMYNLSLVLDVCAWIRARCKTFNVAF